MYSNICRRVKSYEYVSFPEAVVVQSGGVGAPDDSKTPTSSITLPLQLVSLKLSDSLPTERHEWYTNEVRLSFP